VVVFLFGHKAR